MILRVVSTSISVLVLIAASVVPYIGFQRKGVRTSKLFGSSSNLLSIFTCFSCGVFLSTCFLGLMPHLQENERDIKAKLNSTSPEQYEKYALFLDSNLLIIIGFVLIVLIEQSAVFCLPSKNSTNSNNRSTSKRSNSTATETISITHTDNQPLVRFNGSGTDSDSEGEIGRIEFRSTGSSHADNDGGHSHEHHHFTPTGSFIQSFILMVALSTHSIFEGIALGAQPNNADFIKFLVSVMLHEVLCSFAYGVKLSKNNVSLKVGLLSIVFLSFTIPIGMLIISFFLDGKELTTLVVKLILEGIASGTFIYVACVEMLADELGHNHHSNPAQGLFKGLSLCVGVLTFFTFNYLIHV